MNKKELVFGGITVIGGYLLFFVLLTVLKLNRLSFISIIIMNVTLATYYIKKYKTDFTGKIEKCIFIVDLFYLSCCLLSCFLCCVHKLLPWNILTSYSLFKLILRVGYGIFIMASCSSFLYFFANRDKIKNLLKFQMRQVLIFLSNLIFLPFAIYHYSYSSTNGRFNEEIIDGLERTHTFYVDSLQNYVTNKHIFIDDNGFSNTDYVIYYKEYPNVVYRIDTIYKRKK